MASLTLALFSHKYLTDDRKHKKLKNNPIQNTHEYYIHALAILRHRGPSQQNTKSVVLKGAFPPALCYAAKLQHYVAFSTDAKLFSGVSDVLEMRRAPPPQGSCARKMHRSSYVKYRQVNIATAVAFIHRSHQ